LISAATLAIALLTQRGEQMMAAEKNRPENGADESGFFEDLTERVFKDYEPPQPKGSVQESEGEATEDNENQNAA